MKDLKINELRKKNLRFGFRVFEEERTVVENYCSREQISMTDFFRIAIRKVINDKSSK